MTPVYLCVFSCVYTILLPNGVPARTAKRVLAVLFLFSVVAPLFSVVDDLLLPDLTAFSEQSAVSDSPDLASVYAGAGADAIRREAEKKLCAQTDIPFRIEVSSHIEDQTNIYIDRITVIFARDFQARSSVCSAAAEALGIPVVSEVMRSDGTPENGDFTGGAE